MNYTQKLKECRPFVNIKINGNKKNFTPQEKRLITYYCNKLKNLGYFDRETEGFLLVSIKPKQAPKVKGAPRIVKRYFEVGTIVKDGKLITNPKRKVKFSKGKAYVTQDGVPRIWRFEYNIAKNWSEPDFIEHIKEQIGEDGLKKTQYFAIGAGIKYEVRNSPNNSLTTVAREILKIGYRYTPDLQAEYEHKGQKKKLDDWLQEIVVYEYFDDLESRIKNEKYRKKKSKRKVKK